MSRPIAAALVLFAFLAAAALPVGAQAPGKVYRVALLATHPLPGELRGLPLPALTELARHSFVEGRNLRLEAHLGERLADLTRELVATLPDVIWAGGLPAAHRVALLRDPQSNPVEHVAALEAAAHDLGIAVAVIEVRRPEEIAGALRQARAAGAEAVTVLEAPMFFEQADPLSVAAIGAGLPTTCIGVPGCLANYGVNVDVQNGWRAASPISELPVVQPTKFELVINLKTAKA
jgi:hypothetical protein